MIFRAPTSISTAPCEIPISGLRRVGLMQAKSRVRCGLIGIDGNQDSLIPSKSYRLCLGRRRVSHAVLPSVGLCGFVHLRLECEPRSLGLMASIDPARQKGGCIM